MGSYHVGRFEAIDEDDNGSRAYDAGGTFVGRYNRVSDQTSDEGGKRLRN